MKLVRNSLAGRKGFHSLGLSLLGTRRYPEQYARSLPSPVQQSVERTFLPHATDRFASTQSLSAPPDYSGREAGWPALPYFFTVHIHNPNTRAAYSHAASVFLRWYEERGLAELGLVQPIDVAAFTTVLYDRSNDDISVSELEPVGIWLHGMGFFTRAASSNHLFFVVRSSSRNSITRTFTIVKVRYPVFGGSADSNCLLRSCYWTQMHRFCDRLLSASMLSIRQRKIS